MKKSIITAALSLLAATFFAGCASTQVTLQEHSPLAVITILGTGDIPWLSDDPEEDSDSGLLTSIVNNAMNSQNPELLTAIDRLDYADDTLRHVIPELTNCEVVEKDKVITSKTYKNMRASYFNTLTPTKNATGYKDFSTIGAKNARYLLNEINAKSLLILDFSFYKHRLSKTACTGVVNMKAKVLNARGKEIVNKVFTAETNEKLEIVNGIYDKDALVSAMNGAIEDVIKQFAVAYMSETGGQEKMTSEEAEEMNKYAVQIKIPPKRAEQSETVQTQEN